MTQSLSESDHICQTFQVHFDGMLCNVLEKYHHFPGFALLLGTLLRYISIMKRGLGDPSIFRIAPGITASLYLVRQRQGHILDDVGFYGIWRASFRGVTLQNGTDEFCAYFAKLLKNPGRSGTHVFDQQRYATAAKECLELCLCSHHNFSKGTVEFTCYKGAPEEQTLGVDSPDWGSTAGYGKPGSIWFDCGQLSINMLPFLKPLPSTNTTDPWRTNGHWMCSHSFWRNRTFRLELADVLRRRTFTTMAYSFPRRRRSAKEAITKYLLRVESAVGGS
jgi:hypothetical protein